jgi:8-oxo-dGTP pyrophosphatase MutT (NUDIX family)
VSVSQVRRIVGLLFFLGAIAALGILRNAGLGKIAVVTFVYLSALMVTIAILLDYPRLPRQAKTNDVADELERRNLLVPTFFCVERAFRVEELHGEGPHYFLELEAGGILHLSGPYLYRYEPSDGSVRHFPCTQFIVRRHAQLGHAVDILCEGVVIEPEVEAPPYTPRDFAQRLVPADGEILRNLTFDQLREQRTALRARML